MQLPSQFISQLHKAQHLFINICFGKHAKVMIELFVIVWYLCDFLKAQVIRIGLFKREDNMNETLAKLGDVSNTLSRSRHANHGFSWV